MELVQEYLIVKNGGISISEHPQSFDMQYKSQHDNTLNEYQVKMSERRWNFGFTLSGISVLVFNLVELFFNIRGIKLQSPIGFIPILFLIGTLYMRGKRSSQLDKLIRERENIEFKVLLNKDVLRS
ncbi:hypothetical protein KC480_05140 [Bacillus velezensis]|uniref:hypothetical protein n=1 Tax=Bacillus velezensis TaxID=492670 RepID=UPI001E59C77B|nr:hypothetical protein [Bacillus velezensis]MCD7910909.1 hypothetical protein [Bacillus velezensis]